MTSKKAQQNNAFFQELLKKEELVITPSHTVLRKVRWQEYYSKAYVHTNKTGSEFLFYYDPMYKQRRITVKKLVQLLDK